MVEGETISSTLVDDDILTRPLVKCEHKFLEVSRTNIKR
jgi:hypothetical protein